MTNFQKACCVILSLCFFTVLALTPEPFYLKDNLFRQFPLYCFLEREAESVSQREDPETSEKIIARNGEYLAGKVLQENGEKYSRQSSAEENVLEMEAESSAGETLSEPQEEFPEKETLTEPQAESSAAETLSDPEAESSAKETLTGPETESLTEETASNPETEYLPEEITPHPEMDLSAKALADYDYLLGQFFIVDSNTAATPEQLNASRFMAENLTINKDVSQPQILIYHSHSQETFADSREGVQEDTIVGVGTYLTELLTENYGYNVIHVTETFDIVDGEIDRSRSYDFAREYVEQVLTENPSIEVIIDLHRDGVPDERRLVTQINGKDTAQIMFYNGLSYTVNNGPVEYLPNPYIQDNLAFSFQLEYQAAMYYPDLYRGIYLAGLRYNLHLLPRALLLEAGAQNNTIQEVKNAMEPFADILNKVLSGTGEIW